jgi:pantoate--beta-alanine ligase
MHVVTTVSDMRRLRSEMDGAVGLVPTMGYLHEGHLSLARCSRRQDDHVVATIFVNPTQFGPGEDYERYPRDEERDLALLREEGVDAVFMPPVEEMYPQGFETYVEVKQMTQVLEGAHRPTHFQGVTTVVAKLLNVVQPHRAYFGQKDAQQLAVVRRMVRDLDLPVEIVAVPTVREADGLAMSSRNAYLSAEEREAAPVLYRSLRLAEELWRQGERDASRMRSRMAELIATEPLARPDYVSVADPETLAELERIEKSALVSLAVRIGKARLIDNVILE